MDRVTEPVPFMASAPAQTYATIPETLRVQQRQTSPPIQLQQPIYDASWAKADDVPTHGSPYAVVGTGTYFWMSVLFTLPVVGWIVCLVTAFAAKRVNLRNYARAVLIMLIIGAMFSVALYFVFTWVWEVIVEYAQSYINEVRF
jgi:hypothetical protein